MKTVFFESLRYILITKNDFYYGSCPDIHIEKAYIALSYTAKYILEWLCIESMIGNVSKHHSYGIRYFVETSICIHWTFSSGL